MKIEETNDLVLVIIQSQSEFGSAFEVLKLKSHNKKVIRLVKDKNIEYFIYNKNMILSEKGMIELDSNGFVITNKEFSSKEELLFHIEYENYPNGETKWERHYDKKGNLLSEDFFEKE